MNTRQDKVELLRAIARGEVSPSNVPIDPLVISSKDEAFLGLMMAASISHEEDGENKVVFVGEAFKALNKMVQSVKESRNEIV